MRSTPPTNLHYHGLGVSPLGRSDDVFIHLGTSEVFDYEVAIPRNHSAGLYWYHPHQHGLVVSQVSGGMSGGLIIEGILDPFPELKRIKERVMLLKDSRIDRDGYGKGRYFRYQISLSKEIVRLSILRDRARNVWS
jgi:suppressor of ftsI